MPARGSQSAKKSKSQIRARSSAGTRQQITVTLLLNMKLYEIGCDIVFGAGAGPAGVAHALGLLQWATWEALLAESRLRPGWRPRPAPDPLNYSQWLPPSPRRPSAGQMERRRGWRLG